MEINGEKCYPSEQELCEVRNKRKKGMRLPY